MYAASVMETGPSAELFDRPAHPYTWLLARAVPRTTGPKLERLQAIEGAPPSLISPPEGCRFRLRCPVSFERCVEVPPARQRGEEREFLCWHEEPETKLASLDSKEVAHA
jgi:peptide/nickel transport system ATP-binding protein